MEASQMAAVKRIEQVMETAYREMRELQGDLIDINKKLLPVQVVPEGGQG